MINMMTLAHPSKLRTLLILGRVSNLPTVWSNCLAGWWLAGGGSVWNLIRVSISVTFLYLGGMFLNDAFDSTYDRNHRPTRPIPAGAIAELEVWIWGIGWLLLGLLGLVWFSWTTALLSLTLVGCIVLYNAIHKIVIIGPVFMGGCRFLVYLVAASVAANGVAGESIWKGLALAAYIVGLSFLARKESAPVRINYWPCFLLAAPVFIAALFDDGADQRAAFCCGCLLIAWVIWTLWQTFGREHPSVGLAVSRLLAGIAVVDLLAVADFSHFAIILFPICFFLAWWLQGFISAT